MSTCSQENERRIQVMTYITIANIPPIPIELGLNNFFKGFLLIAFINSCSSCLSNQL